jgi:transposase-like protein
MYENRRCPFCLDFGKKTFGEKIEASFKCNKCDIVFDEFVVSSAEYPQYRDTYWN